MSPPIDEQPRRQNLATDWATKLGAGAPPAERRVRRRRQADRDLERSNRLLRIGNCILGVVVVLTVVAGLAMIMNGCTEEGSPFVAEPGGYLRTR